MGHKWLLAIAILLLMFWSAVGLMAHEILF